MDVITFLFSLIGIGTIINSVLIYQLDKHKIKNNSNHELKEQRYKAIIILSYSLIYYEKSSENIKRIRPEIETKEHLYDELFLEWKNMMLYASDDVIIAMKEFLMKNTENNLNELILVMRKDLYNIKTKMTKDNIILNIESEE